MYLFVFLHVFIHVYVHVYIYICIYVHPCIRTYVERHQIGLPNESISPILSSARENPGRKPTMKLGPAPKLGPTLYLLQGWPSFVQDAYQGYKELTSEPVDKWALVGEGQHRGEIWPTASPSSHHHGIASPSVASPNCMGSICCPISALQKLPNRMM